MDRMMDGQNNRQNNGWMMIDGTIDRYNSRCKDRMMDGWIKQWMIDRMMDEWIE